MMLLVKILVIVYFLAVNCYSFSLMAIQKKQATATSPPKRKVTDKKILLSGTLGGALGVYISTFILKYRRDSILIMVLMPLLVAVTLYGIITAFIYGFWIR